VLEDGIQSDYHLQQSISLPANALLETARSIGFVPEIHDFHVPAWCMDRRLQRICINPNGNTKVQNLGSEIGRHK
jgi:hypothetical protein